MSRPSVKSLVAVVAVGLLATACVAAGPAGAEQSGGAGVVVSFDGSISPRYIPRQRSAPISLTLSGGVESADGAPPPQLQRLEIAFAARGGLETSGLGVCPRARLRDATQQQALERCRGALVGHGGIVAEVPLDPEKPLLAHASVLAFNGHAGRRPAVWVHAYSASPPVSFVLPFYVGRLEGGAYGLMMRSPIRQALGQWPRLRSFSIVLGRRYRAGEEWQSYLSANCPLPSKFSIGILPLARAIYYFSPHPTLATTILRGCRVRR